jgi:hypothetical protein
MKKLLILLAFVPMLSYGQFSKGTKFVGGNFNINTFDFQSTQSNYGPTTYLALNGNLGFFISESFAIGPDMKVVSNSQSYTDPYSNESGKFKDNNILGGIFARKFFPITEMFLFSVEGKGLVGNSKQNAAFGREEVSETSLHIGFRPIFSFLPTKRWAFDAGIGEISFNKNIQNVASNSNAFNFRLGHVTLGVNYFFNRKVEE